MAATITLYGLAAQSDRVRNRLCFTLVNMLENSHKYGLDQTCSRLVRACRGVARNQRGIRPYKLYYKGQPNEDGIQGQFWVTLRHMDKERAERLMDYADEMRGAEVEIQVRPQRYSFKGHYGPRAGMQIDGVQLVHVNGPIRLEKEGETS